LEIGRLFQAAKRLLAQRRARRLLLDVEDVGQLGYRLALLLVDGAFVHGKLARDGVNLEVVQVVQAQDECALMVDAGELLQRIDQQPLRRLARGHAALAQQLAVDGKLLEWAGSRQRAVHRPASSSGLSIGSVRHWCSAPCTASAICGLEMAAVLFMVGAGLVHAKTQRRRWDCLAGLNEIGGLLCVAAYHEGCGIESR
jgi:hypothetical protein